MTDLDFDLAIFAARTSGTRNLSVHGESYNQFMSRDYTGLAEQTDEDDKNLERLVAHEEKHLAGKYRRSFTFQSTIA